jgi:hypothetical protein
MRAAACLTALLLIASPAMAMDAGESIVLAQQLGSVMGSEEGCGLTFNQPAIEAFIAQKVDADDMSFPSNLSLFIRGQQREFANMKTSQKTAHCAQIKRIAKRFGFIK